MKDKKRPIKSGMKIPREIVETLGLKPDDLLVWDVIDGKIVLTPIPHDQEWFWSEEWQRGKREAEGDIKAGRVSGPMSVEETIRCLNSDDSGKWANE